MTGDIYVAEVTGGEGQWAFVGIAHNTGPDQWAPVRGSVSSDCVSQIGDGPDGGFIAIPTGPRADGDECRLSLLAGTLIVHPVWGVAVDGGTGPVLVFWPNGWSAHRTDDRAALLDRQGFVVAHTGDEVRGAGGMVEVRGREGFGVCANGLHFEPAQP